VGNEQKIQLVAYDLIHNSAYVREGQKIFLLRQPDYTSRVRVNCERLKHITKSPTPFEMCKDDTFFDSIDDLRKWLGQMEQMEIRNWYNALVSFATKDKLEMILDQAELDISKGNYLAAARVAEGVQYADNANRDLLYRASVIARGIIDAKVDDTWIIFTANEVIKKFDENSRK